MYEQTQRSPIVIPVVNIIGAGGKPVSSNSGNGGNNNNKPSQPEKTPEQVAAEQQDRFAQMRQQLLGHDPRTD